MLLSGKIAIVTGASRGIGWAIARLYAENGAKVIVNGSNSETIKAAAKEIAKQTGGICLPLAGDISKKETAEELLRFSLSEFGRADILVNNAGTITRTSTLDMTIDDWDRVLDVNLKSSLYTCRTFIPVMLENRSGAIINISSGAGKKPHPNAAVSYDVSKAGIIALTRHLALEYGGAGIRTNAICPGPVSSEMSDQWSDEYRKKVISTIPLGHMGTPEDVAGAALFLASDLAGFVLGESINVNGGTLMD